MGLTLWIARSVGSTILGILVFAGFLVFLLVNSVSGKLLSADFYTQVLNEQDTYNRIYDEVLLDDELRRNTSNLLMGTQIVTHEEIVQLSREIIPPEYLRSQIEENIRSFIVYLRKDSDYLELYIELGPPLANVKSALFGLIDQRINELEIVEPDPDKGLIEQVTDLQPLAQSLFSGLSQGRLPRSIPSVEAIPQPLRGGLFDALLANLPSDQLLDEEVRQSLELNSQNMRSALVAGDTREFLKQAARAVLDPSIDNAIDEFRQNLNLDRQDRLDVINAIARENDDTTEEGLRSEIADFRDSLNRFLTLGKTISLSIAIGGAVLMGLIYLPSLTNALRWPGLTLLLTGAVLYALGRVVEATLPNQIINLIDRALIAQSIEKSSAMPPSAIDLVKDILYSFGQQLIEGIADPALILIIVGAVLFGGSFLVYAAWPRIPALPWLRA